MGDPVSVARHAREALAPGGRLVTLDPAAGGNSLAENLADPFAAMLYAVSTLHLHAQCHRPGAAREALGAWPAKRPSSGCLRDAGFGTDRPGSATTHR